MNQEKKIRNKSFFKTLVIFLIFNYLLFLVPFLLEYFSPHLDYVNIPLHSTIEAFGSFASIMMGVLFFIVIIDEKKLEFNILAMGFIAMGILHGFHALIHVGKDFVFLFSMGSLLGSFGFFLGSISKTICAKNYRNVLLLIVIFLIIIIGISSIVFESYLPAMSANEGFTPIALIINILSGVLYILSAVIILKRNIGKLDIQMLLLICIAMLLGISGITFNYSHLWSFVWWYLHIIRLLAFILLLIIGFFNLNRIQDGLQKQFVEISKINKRLDDYSYTISHDLKEPIRSIRTFSEFIEEDYSGNFDEEGKDYLSRIIKASKRMATMIDDLLSLSRVGRVDQNFAFVDMNIIFSDLKEMLKHLIDSRNVKIEIKHMPIVYCQEVWIKSVFQNLISNAIKYNDKEIPEINISYRKINNYYEFSIKDNGKGIESGQIENIFKLFRKAHQDRNQEGSGAGLTIVETIILQHGGKVWVENSVLGEGTDIRFTIKKKRKK